MVDSEETSLSINKVQFDELVNEIRTLGRALVASQIKHERGTEKNAKFLKVFGFVEQDIADLLGVTQPAVNQALKAKPKRKKKS